MIILAIDPGRRTGYAKIEAQRERVLGFGWLKRPGPRFQGRVLRLMEAADMLVIEDQYVGVNPQSAMRVVEAKSEIIAWWAERGPMITINPQTWQSAMDLRGKRALRKAGSLRLARALVAQAAPTPTEDEADAILMGLAAARRWKNLEFTRRRD